MQSSIARSGQGQRYRKLPSQAVGLSSLQPRSSKLRHRPVKVAHGSCCYESFESPEENIESSGECCPSPMITASATCPSSSHSRLSSTNGCRPVEAIPNATKLSLKSSSSSSATSEALSSTNWPTSQATNNVILIFSNVYRGLRAKLF